MKTVSHSQIAFFKKFNLHNYLQHMVGSSSETKQIYQATMEKQEINKMILNDETTSNLALRKKKSFSYSLTHRKMKYSV